MENYNLDLSKEIKKLEGMLATQYPNLNLEDFLAFISLYIRHMKGRGLYAGLELTLENDNHLKDLKALSYGYIEFDGKIVKMGVTKLENLEKKNRTYTNFHAFKKFEYSFRKRIRIYS